jgi:hypothetical protein
LPLTRQTIEWKDKAFTSLINVSNLQIAVTEIGL